MTDATGLHHIRGSYAHAQEGSLNISLRLTAFCTKNWQTPIHHPSLPDTNFLKQNQPPFLSHTHKHAHAQIKTALLPCIKSLESKEAKGLA